MEKPTYEELEKENKTLKQEKFSRQKSAMHTVRELCLTLRDFCGVNKLPVSIELDFDWDRKDFNDYVPKSMVR